MCRHWQEGTVTFVSIKFSNIYIYLRDNNTCALRSCVDLICIGNNKTQYGLSVIWQIQISVQQKEKESKQINKHQLLNFGGKINKKYTSQ